MRSRWSSLSIFEKYVRRLSKDQYILFIGTIAASTGFIYGYIAKSMIDPVLLQLSKSSSYNGSIYTNVKLLFLSSIGQFIGSFFNYIFTDSFGKITVIFYSSILSLLMLIWSDLTIHPEVFLSTRTAFGFLMGMLLPSISLYTAEVSLFLSTYLLNKNHESMMYMN
jgi:MFS family permease